MCLCSCLESWKLDKGYVGYDMMTSCHLKEGYLSLRICLCILNGYGGMELSLSKRLVMSLSAP